MIVTRYFLFAQTAFCHFFILKFSFFLLFSYNPIVLFFHAFSLTFSLYFFPCRLDLSCQKGAFSLTANYDSILIPLKNTEKVEKGKIFSFLVHPFNATKALKTVIYNPSNSYSGFDILKLTVTSLIPSNGLAVISDPLKSPIQRPPFTDGVSVTSELSVAVLASGYLKFSCLSDVESLEDESFPLGKTLNYSFQLFD